MSIVDRVSTIIDEVLYAPFLSSLFYLRKHSILNPNQFETQKQLLPGRAVCFPPSHHEHLPMGRRCLLSYGEKAAIDAWVQKMPH